MLLLISLLEHSVCATANSEQPLYSCFTAVATRCSSALEQQAETATLMPLCNASTVFQQSSEQHTLHVNTSCQDKGRV